MNVFERSHFNDLLREMMRHSPRGPAHRFKAGGLEITTTRPLAWAGFEGKPLLMDAEVAIGEAWSLLKDGLSMIESSSRVDARTDWDKAYLLGYREAMSDFLRACLESAGMDPEQVPFHWTFPGRKRTTVEVGSP